MSFELQLILRSGPSSISESVCQPSSSANRPYLLTPFVSYSYKLPISQLLCFDIFTNTRRVGIHPLHSSFNLQRSKTNLCLFKLLRTLLQIFALFCTHPKIKSFPFKHFRTLLQKVVGGGRGAPPATSSAHIRSPLYFLTSLRHYFFP